MSSLDDLVLGPDDQPADDWSPNVYDWVALGVDLGFCSDVVCLTHEGPPLTDSEEQADTYDDDCMYGVRIWP